MNRSSGRDIAIVGAPGGSPLPSSPQSRNRRSIRLRGYDYSQAGAYFVTICTQNRECLFGAITRGEMRLNEAGLVVADEWMKTAVIRDEIELDEWVVMPNHFHGILVITGSGAVTHGGVDRSVHGRGDRPVAPTGPQPGSVGAVMAGFKSAVTKRINERRQTPGAKIWQRNYWEHIVRNEPELNRIREYIHTNPVQWEMDKLHPDNWVFNGRGDQPVALTEIREPSMSYETEESYVTEEWMV